MLIDEPLEEEFINRDLIRTITGGDEFIGRNFRETNIILRPPIKLTHKKYKPICKERNSECPISYEQIKINDTYLSCGICKYNFSENSIVKHLNERERNCPMCRSNWTNYCQYVNKIYINFELLNATTNTKIIYYNKIQIIHCKKDNKNMCNKGNKKRYNK